MDKINAETMKRISDENYKTFLKKNADYGSSFERSLNELGIIAGVTRILDKFNRLKNLVKSKAQVKESLSDTLKDMANYCLMLAVWLEGNNGN